MDALIKDESMDFATLKFGKVEKIPEIAAFLTSKDHFSRCEAHFCEQNRPDIPPENRSSERLEDEPRPSLDTNS